MDKKIILKDIANALGVHKATVSRALNDHPDVSEKTRERIKEKALELGYHPDPALRRLAEYRWGDYSSSRSTSLAVIKWARGGEVEFFHGLIDELEKASKVLGYGFEVLYVSDYPDPNSAVKVLDARGVTGLVVVGSRFTDAWKEFPWSRFSAVKVSPWREERIGLDLVVFDNFAMMLDAGQRILKKKPKSAGIFLVRSEEEPLTDLYCHAAALLVVEAWNVEGVACEQPVVVQLPLTPKGWVDINKKLSNWLASGKIEVAVVMNASVKYDLSSAGLSFPKDIQLIVLDRQGDSSFAGYERQPQLVAENAVQHLDSLVRQGKRGVPKYSKTILVPNRWVSGSSFLE